jgi:HD-like signal output (HDOD) protein
MIVLREEPRKFPSQSRSPFGRSAQGVQAASSRAPRKNLGQPGTLFMPAARMSTLVYVVDDQPEVLETVLLVLQSIDPAWRVEGFTSATAALAAVKTQPPDLVLSDHRMPEMPGGKLLEEVRVAAPNAVRIIMSGYVDLNALSAVISAHQYIAKPFAMLQVKDLIQHTFAARTRMERQGLQQMVTALRSLPSLPHIHYALLKALGNEHRSVDAVAQLVAQDAGLSGKLLQVANSPLFGRGSLVSSPFDAVLCLGTEMIKAVVLSQELFRHYGEIQCPEIDLPRLWNHCWQVAHLVQGICLERELPQAKADEAFLAGLLHEAGKLILIDNFPQQFHEACQAALQARAPLTPFLLRTFAATPAQLAAYLLELWGLPSAVIQAVASQEHPEDDPSGEFSLVTALYIADQVATRNSPPDSFAIPDWNAKCLQALGCEPELAVWQRFGPAV